MSLRRHVRSPLRRGIAVLSSLLLAGAFLTAQASSANAATVDTSVWHVLVNRNSGKALDVYDRSNADGGRIWLRVNADIRPGSGRQAHFSYSTDGTNFVGLGPGFTLNNAWQFFMGYRFGIFNYATQSLGGAVTVRRFDLTTP
jgi:hypothetical protein